MDSFNDNLHLGEIKLCDYNYPVNGDAIFKIIEHDKETIMKADKGILSRKSNVFRRMFSDTWNRKYPIQIIDTHVSVFKLFLR